MGTFGSVGVEQIQDNLYKQLLDQLSAFFHLVLALENTTDTKTIETSSNNSDNGINESTWLLFSVGLAMFTSFSSVNMSFQGDLQSLIPPSSYPFVVEYLQKTFLDEQVSANVR